MNCQNSDNVENNKHVVVDKKKADKENILYIVDGYSIFFKAYYANAKLVYNNQPIGMIYGTINSILKIIKDFKPNNLVFALDSPGKNFRHELYSDYKTNRPKVEDDLIVQLKQIPFILEKLNIPFIQKSGYEADDIIGSLAKQLHNQYDKIIIIAVDKDLLQLVDKKISMYHTMHNMFFDNDAVKKKYDIEASQMIDYLSLVGDASDNIPGVKSVGPKTAAILLNEYKTLDAVLNAANNMTKKNLKKNLIEFKENAILSKKLVQLNNNIKLDIASIDDFNYKPVKDIEELVVLFGFKTLANKVLALYYNYNEIKLDQKTVVSIDDITMLYSILDQIRESGICCFALLNNVLHIGFVGCEYSLSDETPDLKKEFLNFILSGDTINITYDLKSILYYLNYSVDNIYFANHDSNKKLDNKNNSYIIHDIEILYYLHFKGIKPISLQSIIDYFFYNKNNIIYMYDIFHILSQELIANKQYSLYQNIELYMPYILYSIEKNGVKLDVSSLDKINFILNQELEVVVDRIFVITGERFQISSNKILGEILFEKLKMPYAKKLKKSNTYSTDSEILLNIANDGYEIGELLIKWRQLTKLQNTYVNKLPKHVLNGRVYTNFNALGTISGRLSSNNPNLQNIPVSQEYNIRSAFTSAEGCSLISFDYSQIELVVLANLIDEENMKKAFKEGVDIHKATAALIFNINDIKFVTDHQRRKAKAINFGIIYGMSAFGLSKSLKVPLHEAKEYIDIYIKRYPKIQGFIAQQLILGKEKGHITNMFNRNCIIEDRNIRAAINLPIQSAAADILKMAMIEIYKIMPDYNAKMILQVHDELVFEVNDKCKDIFIQKISQIMESVYITLKVNVKSGASWG